MANERMIPGHGDWQPYGLQHLQRYQFALERVRDRRVLDLACGVGYGSFVLSQTATSCLGIDLSPAAISYAEARYRRANLTYRIGDAAAPVAAAGSIDAVVSFETIEHLADPRALVAHAHRVLSPRGLLIVSAPNALQFSRAAEPRPNEFHLSEPSYEEIVDWLSPWFSIREEWEQAPVLPTLSHGAYAEWRRDLVDRRLKIRRFSAAPLRWLESGERALRRALGKELPVSPAEETEATVLLNLSEIIPLLPERRAACSQYLFVCQRLDHPAV